MPTFVIHSLGQHSRKLAIDSPPVRVGRDPECDIVIADQTASREHAVFMTDAAGRWFPMDEAQALFRKLHEVKRSRLERTDGRRDGPVRVELSEERPIQVGKDGASDMRLYGFVFGGGFRITWGGSFFVVDSAMVYPSMRVNGATARKARLRSGDVIQVGPNHFVFTTE